MINNLISECFDIVILPLNCQEIYFCSSQLFYLNKDFESFFSICTFNFSTKMLGKQPLQTVFQCFYTIFLRIPLPINLDPRKMAWLKQNQAEEDMREQNYKLRVPLAFGPSVQNDHVVLWFIHLLQNTLSARKQQIIG